MFEKIVLVSSNIGKLKEFSRLFADLNIEALLQPQSDVPECPEPYHAFVEDALAKALHAAKHSGLSAPADDSGVCTVILNGVPGVLSARYTGANPRSDTANNKHLSDNLADKADKSCYYVCVLVFAHHESGPQPIIAEGIWRGQWQTEAAGTHGFGYGPYFYLLEHNCTAAELAPEIKNAESHRGQTLRELLRKIEVL